MAFLLLCGASEVVSTTIRNYRHGESDSPYDIHDGTIARWDAEGPFYWYGMAYTNCHTNSAAPWLYGAVNSWINNFNCRLLGTCNGFNCAPIMFSGFGTDCGFLNAERGQTVKVWSSTDLVSWTLVGDAFDSSSPHVADDVLFRPSVMFNEKSGKYVIHTALTLAHPLAPPAVSLPARPC